MSAATVCTVRSARPSVFPEVSLQMLRMTNREHTQQVIDWVRQRTDSVILFYSTGKDSIAMLDLVAPHFKRVVCVYMYFVPGLEHIRKYIDWATLRYPNVEFVEVPHWNLTYILRSGMYCTPQPDVKLMKLGDVARNCRLRFGIEWCFYGMKQADGMNRCIMLRGKDYELQAIQPKTRNVYPLSVWSNNEVLAYIRQNRLPEPVCYDRKTKSQGLVFSEASFLYLRENYPGDLEKILAAFPQAEVILYKHDHPNG